VRFGMVIGRKWDDIWKEIGLDLHFICRYVLYLCCIGHMGWLAILSNWLRLRRMNGEALGRENGDHNGGWKMNTN
jgi:hypothetical protein